MRLKTVKVSGIVSVDSSSMGYRRSVGARPFHLQGEVLAMCPRLLANGRKNIFQRQQRSKANSPTM
jgi:hypothetical protein